MRRSELAAGLLHATGGAGENPVVVFLDQNSGVTYVINQVRYEAAHHGPDGPGATVFLRGEAQ